MDKESRLRPKKVTRKDSESFESPNEDEDSKKMFLCPYKGCGKQFTESGNLKTHIRIHVVSFTVFWTTLHRLVKDHLYVTIQIVAKASLQKGIWKATFWPIQVKSHMFVRIVAKNILESEG